MKKKHRLKQHSDLFKTVGFCPVVCTWMCIALCNNVKEKEIPFEDNMYNLYLPPSPEENWRPYAGW